jgi:predicted nucleotidyltransferase
MSMATQNQSELLRIARQVGIASGAKFVTLIGSKARGDAKFDSDTDLVLVFENNLAVSEITERLIQADTATLPRTYALDLIPIHETDYLEQNNPIAVAAHLEGQVLYAR